VATQRRDGTEQRQMEEERHGARARRGSYAQCRVLGNAPLGTTLQSVRKKSIAIVHIPPSHIDTNSHPLQLQYTTLYSTRHYTTLHYTKLHDTTLHSTPLHYTTLHCTPRRSNHTTPCSPHLEAWASGSRCDIPRHTHRTERTGPHRCPVCTSDKPSVCC
jgi:hypothetical protein